MRKLTRTVKVLAITTLTAVAMLGLTAAPANADSTCPTGNLCLWTSPNETGTKKIMTLSPGNCVNLAGSWDNNVESIWNKSTSYYYAFTNYNCSGTPATLILKPGYEYLVMQSTFVNTISSVQRSSS